MIPLYDEKKSVKFIPAERNYTHKKSFPTTDRIFSAKITANTDDDDGEDDPGRPAALDIKVPGSSRRKQPEGQVQVQTQTTTARPGQPIIIRKSPPRPPIILDTAICVLLVLVFGLVCRRIL